MDQKPEELPKSWTLDRRDFTAAVDDDSGSEAPVSRG